MRHNDGVSQQNRTAAQAAKAAEQDQPVEMSVGEIPADSLREEYAELVERVRQARVEYYQQDGTTPAGDKADVSIVRISLTIEREGLQEQNATQTLITDVHLRNRS